MVRMLLPVLLGWNFGWGQGPFSRLTRDFEVLMRTHGEVTFAPYVHGDYRRFNPEPGYRSDFQAYVDFFAYKGFVSTWLIANSTLMERNQQASLALDKIRYTLTPGYRYELKNFLLNGRLLHECIHTISKPEEQGSIWWNSFQFGFGSKAAYPQYFLKTFKSRRSGIIPTFDFNINIGAFLHGDQSVWIGQNHDYRYETFYMIRSHLAKYGNWGMYADWNHHSWLDKNYGVEHKLSISLNILLAGRLNFASVYYEYFPYDSFSKDNQNRLGAAGFKIVF